MRIRFDEGGEPFVLTYEAGDHAMLRSDERGPYATGRAGEWGRVTAACPRTGTLTLLVVGHARPADAPVHSLSGLSARDLTPCDARGNPLRLPGERRRAERRAAPPRPPTEARLARSPPRRGRRGALAYAVGAAAAVGAAVALAAL